MFILAAFILAAWSALAIIIINWFDDGEDDAEILDALDAVD